MKIRTLFLLIIISLGIFFLGKGGYLHWVEQAGEVISLPIVYGASQFRKSIERQYRIITFWKTGEERIQNLEQRNWELTSLIAENTALKSEVEALKRQVKIVGQTENKLIMAQVLSNSEGLMLDKGSVNGVKVGGVVVLENIYIGEIIRVTPRRSFVRLPTGGGSKISVKIGSSRGEVVGNFDTAMILDKVAQTETVSSGDFIFTSGEGEIGTADLIVGKVGKMKGIDSDVFRRAEVLPILDYRHLDKVFIIYVE